jgi:PAS domain-containing protein
MLDGILNNPGLVNYLTRFKSDQIIFLGGDDSQDLYILVSGQVAVFKGDKKIRELTKKGSLFGEVSFFLGSTRTASVRTKNDVSVLRIPKEEITIFLDEFPEAAREITRHLAQWLDETSQLLYGLKEFCDQLPDAVILTDRNGKILTWNSTAETLYGRSWQQMRNADTAEIYEDPQAYNKFLFMTARNEAK